MKRVFVTVVLALGIVAVSELARADTLSLYKPTASTASSTSFNTVGDLFDGAVTQADIGTSTNVGDQWACNGDSGDTDPTVAMNFGSSLTFNTLVYSQRPSYWAPPSGPLYTDYVDSIDLWFGSSAFSATYPATIPAAPADETLTISHVDGLVRYDFAGAHTGQYVLARLNSSYIPFTGNPGGAEFLLGSAVPEPSTLVLLTCGLLSLLAYAWRKRK